MQIRGDAETESENAALIKALTGRDHKNNEKGIYFFDALGENVKKRIDAKSGAFVDGWGNFYRIRFDADEDGNVDNPYKNEKSPLHKDAIIWSLGKDGVQGKGGDSNTLYLSDDIVSWQY